MAEIETAHPGYPGSQDRFHAGVYSKWMSAKRHAIKPPITAAGLDERPAHYNNGRTHQGRMGRGRTPMQTPMYGKETWNVKITPLNS